MLNIVKSTKKKTQSPVIAPDDLIVDWQPEIGEIVIFRDSTGYYKFGMYSGMFNDIRNLRSPEDDRMGKHFEASPYHHECLEGKNFTIRAKVNYAHKMADGAWEISFNHGYISIDYDCILENTRDNRLFAADYNAIKNAIAETAVA